MIYIVRNAPGMPIAAVLRNGAGTKKQQKGDQPGAQQTYYAIDLYEKIPFIGYFLTGNFSQFYTVIKNIK